MNKILREQSGFIVHPFETWDNKYHASYGNHNKTTKSFETLRDAKTYLRNKGVKEADYDSPSGVKLVRTLSTSHKKKKHTYQVGFGGLFSRKQPKQQKRMSFW